MYNSRLSKARVKMNLGPYVRRVRNRDIVILSWRTGDAPVSGKGSTGKGARMFARMTASRRWNAAGSEVALNARIR